MKNKKTAKDGALVLMSNGIAQVSSFLIVLLTSHSFSVSMYGLYTVLNSLASFVSDMADMGMNGAITRFVAEFRGKKDSKSENELIRYSLKRKIINLVIVFLVIMAAAKPIAKYWLHDQRMYRYVYLIIITCAFSLLMGALRSILQGRQEFDRYFVSIVVWNIGWLAIMLILYYSNHLTIVSSIVAQAFSGFVNVILSFKLVRFNYKEFKQKTDISPDIKKKFNGFGNWMILWSLFALLQSRADVFMLATFTVPEQVSYYDIASKLTKPILMVVSAYSQVLNPQFATITIKGELKKKIRQTSKFIYFITLVIIAGIFLIKPLVLLFFGHKYDASIVPGQMLLFAIIFFVWTVPFNSALYALNRPYIFALAAGIGLFVTVVGDYLLLGRYGAIGAAWTYILAQIVGLIVAVVAYKVIMKNERVKLR